MSGTRLEEALLEPSEVPGKLTWVVEDDAEVADYVPEDNRRQDMQKIVIAPGNGGGFVVMQWDSDEECYRKVGVVAQEWQAHLIAAQILDAPIGESVVVQMYL